MVVVVADAGLVAGDGAGGLDAADEPGRRQRAQHVVHGLVRDGGQLGAHGPDELVGVGVRSGVNGGQDGPPRPRHAQSGIPQDLVVRGGRGHVASLAHKLERIK